MAKYTVRVTTYYPSFVVEADSEQAALELAYATPWPNDAQSFGQGVAYANPWPNDAQSFFELEEEEHDVNE